MKIFNLDKELFKANKKYWKSYYYILGVVIYGESEKKIHPYDAIFICEALEIIAKKDKVTDGLHWGVFRNGITIF